MKPFNTLLIVAAVTLDAVAAFAQPRISNGELRTTPVAGPLTRTAIERMAPTGIAWVGYAVPIVPGEHQMCCWNGDQAGCCAGCRLEPRPDSATTAPPQSGIGPVRLEGAAQLFVLFRVENGRINRIRTFSEDCPLDAGGLSLHWLTGVRPADSVATLAAFFEAATERRLANGVLAALAMHAESSALERLATAARQGATTDLRGQALFWLAQRAGEKAAGVITDAIARDPETDVKKRAVFALSQLPKDEGVPRLIEVARTNTNPAVRKQAMFWLGQSRDPRALRFFEEILFK